MKVLLIQPPYPYSEFPKPASALMYMGAVLRRAGVEVQLLDLLSTRYSPEKIAVRLAQFQPRLIGITSVTMNFPLAIQTARTCKRLLPEATIVLGGPHVTFTSRETLRDFPEVDLIVRGEGEETIRELVDALAGGSSLAAVRGLTYRQNGGIVQTEDRPFIQDLDSLPFPDRTLYPLSRYLAMRVPASVLSSRGCPTGCSFCVGYQMTGRQGRFRNPALVVNEIEAACRLGFAEVCIDDDLFTRNRRHVLAICDEILSRGLKIKIFIFARVDTVDHELLTKLKAAGCAMICFGLESGNQQILDRARKRTTLEKIRQAVQLTKDAGIAPFGSFILGLPGETRATMEETVSFAQGLQIPYGFHLLAPFPGTRVREKAEEYGIRILSDDWTLYDADHAVTETGELAAAEVERFAHSFFQPLTAAVDKMKAETLAGTYHGTYREEMEKRLQVDFAWKLLAADLLEEQGEIFREEAGASGPGPTLPALAGRLAPLVSLPLAYVESQLDRLNEGGLIVCRESDRSALWRWRED